MTENSSPRLQTNPGITLRFECSAGMNINACVGQGSRRNEYVLNNPALVAYLLSIRSAVERDLIEADIGRLMGYSGEATRTFVDLLVREALLVDPSSPSLRAKVQRWSESGWRDALDFHLATSNVRWTHSYRNWAEKPPVMTYFLDDQLVTPDRPRPARRKVRPDRLIELPNPEQSACIRSDFLRAVRERRTTRSFKSTTASLEELSDILHVSCRHLLYQGTRPFRPTPTYSLGYFYRLLLVNPCIDGLERREAYSYVEESHELEKLGPLDVRDNAHELFSGQDFTADAPILIILTVQWEQYMWKYRHSRAYRMALFEIGGVAQTILVAATGLGFQTFLTPALNDSPLCAQLGINDQLAESPIYLLALGRRPLARTTKL